MLRLVTVCRPAKAFIFYSGHPDVCIAVIIMMMMMMIIFFSFFTGLPVRPSHKMGFRSSAAKNGLPGEGRHEGLVPRNYVLTNGFI